jgi:hypothetical protein
MHGYTLQDWTTIRGAAGALTMTQEENGWLDLTPYQDVVFWVDVKSALVTATMTLQTSPSKDDALFLPLASGVVLPPGGNAAPTVVSALMVTALSPNVPLARWVRWQLVGSSGPWDVTFRILASANSPGM